VIDDEIERAYDWAIILGGTNDLNMGRSAADAWEALKKVYAIPLKNGTKVLALTVPECGNCAQVPDTRRNKLNDMVLKHGAEDL